MSKDRKLSKIKDFAFVFSTFCDGSLERLYQSFSIRQKRAGLECFFLTAILYDIYMIVVSNRQDIIIIAIFIVLFVINSGLLFLCKREIQNKRFWISIPHIAFHLASLQLLGSTAAKDHKITSRESLGWYLLLTYLTYVTLPLRLIHCAVLNILIVIQYFMLLCVYTLRPTKTNLHFNEQIISNSILLLTANILGVSSFLVEDKQQRRAFLETRQSLEMKLIIEEESAEQERLLLSVLPEHVAVQMRQDLDQAASQFKKIYMSRHENVSILYADIVGFTAISSTYSAQELVKMLNELFARFDKLAEKYEQLRIKILGDCYYCISGAPVERPDHAVLCVHMGLSMVKAIKYVQKTTNSPVDMRVGIHTGAVLAGVLGQRQWQFDVYSKDVELANKMESSGMAGRVHISATTLSFLKGEFEVEPGYGEKRDEALRIAGIKTYFIVKVLIPLKQETSPNDCLKSTEDTESGTLEVTSNKDEDEENTVGIDNQPVDFKSRLRTELVNRDGHKELIKHTNFYNLAFNDQNKENNYQQQLETFSSVTFLMFLIVRFASSITVFIVFPRSVSSNIIFYAENLFVVIFLALFICNDMFSIFTCGLFCVKSVRQQRALSATCILILGLINTIDTISCAEVQSSSGRSKECYEGGDINGSCLYPSYFSYFVVLILICSSLPACLSYFSKSVLLLITALSQCFDNIFFMGILLECEESRKELTGVTKDRYTLSILLLTVSLTLIFLARHMEQVARVLFLWKCEVEEQRERAEDMRRRNEALVYNILPPYVADHFMGNRQKHKLYSQSYAEVGVLFASMPNFSDFYSEETVNNQGLECLRFLNEVISDFDALLELPKFQEIIKIKTIGSTYMAASGLNCASAPKDVITLRWAHLDQLVEFALELKKALKIINEQSFNHFVLKVGINHGPITAGVIGVGKPHYDIWGNTVNVASRMESTGKAGCIQVTEETCEILQHFGYQFKQRGLVAVKGKGQLMTYYLLQKLDHNLSSTVEDGKEDGNMDSMQSTDLKLPNCGTSDKVGRNEHSFSNNREIEPLLQTNKLD